MILKIASDYEGKCFEVTTADQRFANYPKAFYGRDNSNGERTVCVNLDG